MWNPLRLLPGSERKYYANLYAECRAREKNHGAFLPTGETTAEYVSRTLLLMKRKYQISQTQFDDMVASLAESKQPSDSFWQRHFGPAVVDAKYRLGIAVVDCTGLIAGAKGSRWVGCVWIRLAVRCDGPSAVANADASPDSGTPCNRRQLVFLLPGLAISLH